MTHSYSATRFKTDPRRRRRRYFFFIKASPQRGDLRFSGPPPGQGTGGGVRTCDRQRVPCTSQGEFATYCPTDVQEEEEEDCAS
ncbi:hypothetical protein PoB_007349000 [Plakobranchus ocellatus]|uniref:Uncharacterized protein n=1 Tax=Plakobranchus ocellatus TaxID=259542 RepID=A0AAV4DSM0_9GAST|nr:hypothetical protein PoB_007349000 [Plakobranchus ocellatus]